MKDNEKDNEKLVNPMDINSDMNKENHDAEINGNSLMHEVADISSRYEKTQPETSLKDKIKETKMELRKERDEHRKNREEELLLRKQEKIDKKNRAKIDAKLKKRDKKIVNDEKNHEKKLAKLEKIQRKKEEKIEKRQNRKEAAKLAKEDKKWRKEHKDEYALIKKDEQARKKKEKQERKAFKRQAHLTIKQEKREERANRLREAKAQKEWRKTHKDEWKREKLALKQQRREDKKRRGENRKERGRRMPGGAIAAIIVLGVLTGVLGVTSAVFIGTTSSYANTIDANFQRAYYDTVDGINNLETDLSKAIVSNSSYQQQVLLNKIARVAQGTEANLAQLPFDTETIQKTSSYINQLGDYSESLAKQLAAGKPLTEKQIGLLNKLYQNQAKLKENINMLSEKIMSDNFRFGKNFNMSKDGTYQNDISKEFNKISETSLEYPKMIYDGPFSDSRETKEALNYKGTELSKDEGKAKIQELLVKEDLRDVSYIGKSTSNLLETLNYQATDKNGVSYFIQMVSKGGMISFIDAYKESEASNLSNEETIKIAENFAANLGYKNVKAIWHNDDKNISYINIAPNVNGTVYYPDLIKVKVSKEDGKVIGFEALSYIMNNKDRTVSAKLTLSEAREKVNGKMDVKNQRLAIIPINDKEILCYEFNGNYNNNTYYIYIDAVTGQEVNVLRVIKTNQGELVM